MTARCGVLIAAALFGLGRGGQSASVTLPVRGKELVLRTYGSPGLPPVIVSSGDGGWIHLGPHVAEVLNDGHFVIGFDTRAYLSSFTSGSSTLRVTDVADDYATLIDYAAGNGRAKPVLVGVSEGAPLSVLAATDPRIKSRIQGVVGLGLGDVNELGWHWNDASIYLTKGVPHEPTFSVVSIINRMAPVPLAMIHSTGDEFVPLPEARDVFDRAAEPKRFWVLQASNHRFSDDLNEFDQRLLDALDWIARASVPAGHL